ncbi:LysR family transcriptional regulator [Herbaspirillum camelliae]|uniref:LysR family transcriptional regulator n=1 Tax=Herbaspirillum camelliae TaxID=1892903 RepID=UPI000949F3C2|nr:LysR family transcriptional regulator [Herbaspirillum camelliae]
MQSTSLRYFYQVGRTGSLTAAAERLDVAVSAVSRQIAKIEEETGVPLFERRARGMVLTPAGEVLMAYARRNLLELEQVLAEVRGLQAVGQGVITLACSEGFAWDLLPNVTAQFREQYPGLQFKLHVVGAARASQMVIDGEADLSVTYSLAPAEGLAVAYRESGPVFALMKRDHPLASRKLLALSDLSPYPLALPEVGTTVRQLVDIACSMRGLLFAPVFTSHSLGAVYRFTTRSPDTVALGGFLTVHERAEEDGMILVAMAESELHQRTVQVQTMAGRKLPPAVAAFSDFLIAALRQVRARQELGVR